MISRSKTPMHLRLSTAYSAQVPVSGRGHASNPVWSQTGTKLAYEVNDYAGKIDLYTIDITDKCTKIL